MLLETEGDFIGSIGKVAVYLFALSPAFSMTGDGRLGGLDCLPAEAGFKSWQVP